jgi:hypothetical protein
LSLPFSTDQFLAVFAAYNQAIWPTQVGAYVLGLLALVALWRPGPAASRFILSVLAVMWAFNGIAYNLNFFAAINPLAKGFAALFVLEAVLLLFNAAVAPGVRFMCHADGRTAVSAVLIVHAMLIYEVLGALAGHGGLKGPLFGVSPCPTTIFTAGMLLLARGNSIAILSVIPILWAAIGVTASVLLGIPEDYGLGVAGLMLAAAIVRDGLAGLRPSWAWP